MDHKLDENIKEETIVLFDFKNLEKDKFYDYYISSKLREEKRKNEPNKSNEEIEEEIKKKFNEFVEGKKEKYYNIDEKKRKEFDSVFNQIKLTILFSSGPKILNDEMFYTYSKGKFVIYNNKFFKKLLEIKFRKEYIFKSIIQLDNKDLVFFLIYDQILIYRLQNGNYFQIQAIDENDAYYEPPFVSSCGCSKFYESKFIKKITGNRFICVNDDYYKIYSLNEKNEYSAILMEQYNGGIKMIHELDSNNFIFCWEVSYGISLGFSAHNVIRIYKTKLKEITNNEKNQRLKQLDENFYYNGDKEQGLIKKEEAKRTIENLKFIPEYQQIFYYCEKSKYHNIRSYVLLRNKYFVISVDNRIIIFDINTGEQLKRFELLINEEDNLFFGGINLKKWNCQDDNEFFICIDGNIILFELTNDLRLRIINQSYFPLIRNIKILSEKNNKFFDDRKKENYFREGGINCSSKYCEDLYDSICFAIIYE